jgi:hypothetical protein
MPRSTSILPEPFQPADAEHRVDIAVKSLRPPQAEGTPSPLQSVLDGLWRDRVSIGALAAGSPSIRYAANPARPSPDARQLGRAPAVASAGAAAGGSAGSTATSPVDLRGTLVLVAIGGWSLLLLALQSYRSSVFLALPERPG